jgi:hypothetical protein
MLLKLRSWAQACEVEVQRIVVDNWLPDHPGQTGEHKSRQHMNEADLDRPDGWRNPARAKKRSRASTGDGDSYRDQASLQQMHAGQLAAHWALKPHRFKALWCGRRFGKTEYAKTWIADALVRGWECAWLAPQHKTSSETYSELADLLRPILKAGSKGSGVMRLKTGGRLDFWTLDPGQEWQATPTFHGGG